MKDKIQVIAADDYKALSAALMNREDVVVKGTNMLQLNGQMYTLRNETKKPIGNVIEEYVLIVRKQSKLSNKARKNALRRFLSFYKKQ